MIGITLERGFVSTLDDRDADARYLVVQLGRIVLMLALGRARK